MSAAWQLASESADHIFVELIAMENKENYLFRLQLAVEELHGCGAVYRDTAPVHEVFRGQTVWQGEVVIFDLLNHPKAKKAYAWGHREGINDEGERFVAVLEIPPVVSPGLCRQSRIKSPQYPATTAQGLNRRVPPA